MPATSQPPVPQSLFDAFKTVPDPRMPRGVRHPLGALLTLAVAAIMCGARSVLAISEWGRLRPHLALTLGFTRDEMPSNGTFHYLFKDLDAAAFEACLTAWLLNMQASEEQIAALHMDGKALRGSKTKALPGVHLLSVYAATKGTALAQLKVDSKTNEHKAALELLKLIPLEGTVVTGDAAFAQRDLSQQIVDSGGDYYFRVKGNQPTLGAEIDSAFAESFSP